MTSKQLGKYNIYSNRQSFSHHYPWITFSSIWTCIQRVTIQWYSYYFWCSVNTSDS